MADKKVIVIQGQRVFRTKEHNWRQLCRDRAAGKAVRFVDYPNFEPLHADVFNITDWSPEQFAAMLQPGGKSAPIGGGDWADRGRIIRGTNAM